jgi:hypothetical protein
VCLRFARPTVRIVISTQRRRPQLVQGPQHNKQTRDAIV